MSHILRYAATATLLLFIASWFSAAWAGPLAFGARKVSLTAREQPIASFLQDLLGQVDTPVIVSPAVQGAVNGNFVGDAEATLRSLSRAFNLVTYYDGSVMYVYNANELVSRSLPTSTRAISQRVLQAANHMRLTDQRNFVRVTPDGVLQVTGTQRFVEQMQDLARASQARYMANPTLGFKVFYLRYAWAQDVTVNFGGRQLVIPGVASMLRSLVIARPGSQANVHAQQKLLRPTQPKLKGKGLAATGKEPAADTGADPQDPDAALPLGDLGTVRIEADTRLNAVVVRDSPERLAMYEQLVQSLDIEPQSIEIEATIIDVNTDHATELGINWRASAGRSSLLFGKGDSSDLRLQPGGNVVGSAISPIAKGGVISAVLGDASQFVARISALQMEGAARVVSSPQVVTLSNVEALFDNSSTFYVKVAGRDEVDLFNVTAGTSLRVTPHVFKDPDGVRIKLLVNLEDGTLNRSQPVDGLPSVDRSSINTQALIYEGESLLIGGLTREIKENSTDKVPLFGDIPVVGHLFKNTRRGTARIERMFLITPRLTAKRAPSIGPTSYSRSAAAPATPAPLPAPAAPPPRGGQAVHGSVAGKALPPGYVVPGGVQMAAQAPAAPVATATPTPVAPDAARTLTRDVGCRERDGCIQPGNNSRWQSSSRERGS
jgi:type III secretion protein C